MFHIFLLGLALAASPGPDFFLLTKNTLSNGKKLGYTTFLGNRSSFILHITFAVFGLSLILQQSAVIFTSIRLLGAAYLIYLGYKKLKSRWKKPPGPIEAHSRETITKLQAFRMGFLSNFLNPKVSLFFLSIFPQFVSTEQLSQQPLLIAFVFLIGNSSWYVTTIWVIGMRSVRGIVQKFQYILDIIFGLVFILFGGKIIWEELKNHAASGLLLFPPGPAAK